jgi:hypothetical protein
MKTTTYGDARYFIIFVDDFSRKIFLSLLKRKSEAFEKFKEFKAMVENETSRKIHVLRTDNGGEYCSSNFNLFCKKHGIRRETSTPYTPQQNGVAERYNRTLVEMTRAMLYEQNLNLKFWGEAINYATYILNCLPCKALNQKTPEEAWGGNQPDVSSFRIFGCKTFVHVPEEKRTKLEAKSIECTFLGFSQTSKAYRFLDRSTNKIIISRDVVFIEEEDTKQSIIVSPTITLEESDSLSDPEKDSPPLRR